MGDLTIEIVYFGSGFHTDNDIIVSIPEENIVFMGDIIQAFDRYHRVNSKSEIEPWIASLDRITKSNNDVKNVVANHVGVLPGVVLSDFQDTLRTMRNEQRQKKSAVDSLRAMSSTLNVQEAVNNFEDQFLKNRNEMYFTWEGDLLSLADAYREKEKYSEALMLLKMYEKIFPNSTRVLYSQANIFTVEGEHHLAIEAYKKMLRIDPTNFYYVERIFQLENGQ
jgi:tetratricopeptide (TPR) repeat protein